jgi:tetratricopeptide (TPR) repeat protein
MNRPFSSDIRRTTAALTLTGAAMIVAGPAAAADWPDRPAINPSAVSPRASAAAAAQEAPPRLGEPAAGRATETGQRLADEGYASLRAGDLRTASSRFAAALESRSLTSEQATAVRLALSDVLMRLAEPGLATDLLGSSALPHSYEVLSRRAFALDAVGDRAQAAATYAAAQALAPAPADARLMSLGRLYALSALARGPEALAQLRALEADAGLTAPDLQQAAAIAVKYGDDDLAQRLYGRAHRLAPLSGAVALDAGFSARRSGDDAAALQYFRIGLSDAVRSHDPLATETLRYGVRREVADLSRRWGAVASVFFDDTGSTAGRIPGAARGNIQVGADAYYRPLGYNGGRPVEIFGRAFVTLASRRGDPEGAETTQAFLGARFKPLASQNLILEGSRLIKLGSRAQSDWMVRAAYSATSGLDLQPAETSWQLWQVYGDAAHLVDADETFGLIEGRIGRSFRANPQSRLILAPFAGMHGAYDTGLEREGALGAGVGLWARQWFRETKFVAPQSYVDLTVQYRFRLAGDRRAEGLFASFSVSY